MENKKCNTCHETKPVSSFGSHSTAGINPKCKKCVSAYMKKYRQRNREYFSQYNQQYHEQHAERIRERTRHWNNENPEQKRNNDKQLYQRKKDVYSEQARLRHQKNREANCKRAQEWRQNNKDRVTAQIAKRRCAEKCAIPSWVDFEQIESLYAQASHLTEQTGVPHQVDHIIPLNSDVVCGLHCADNLRVITAEENNKKKNQLDESLIQ